MKVNYTDDINPQGEFTITDSAQISTKNLFAMFLDFSNALSDLIEDSKIVKDFYNITEKVIGEAYKKRLYHDIEALPWQVCDCFIRFIKECPNIELTIR